MKKIFILITGGSGTGKTTISKKLQEMGYEAYDIESIPNLFSLVDKTTGEIVPLEKHNNLDINHVKRVDWICDIKMLQSLIERQKSSVAFYCGVSANIHKLVPLFTKTILLKTDPDVVRNRLTTRTISDFGRDPQVREWVLGRNPVLEAQFVEKFSPLTVYTHGEPQKTVQEILKKVF